MEFNVSESAVSIMPRRVRPGECVTIHVGLINRWQRPIRPSIRLSVIDPGGRPEVLLDSYVLVFPNYRESDTALERRRRMKNFYFQYPVPEQNALGRYRVKLENFLEGNLLYSETMETDFFYVEEIHVHRVSDRGYRVENAGPEPVLATLHEPGDDGIHSERQISIPGNSRIEIETAGDPAFLEYAATEIVTLTCSESPMCHRNQRYFWRNEDDHTVFVLDPRAEKKRNFFLTGDAREVWQASNGVSLRRDVCADGRSKAYDQLVEKRLIVEIPA